MKHVFIAFAFSCTVFAASPCSQSGVVFCNGFEGVKQEINDAWGSPNAGYFMTADAGPFGVAGNQVLKLSAGGGYVHVIKRLPAGYSRLHARWYQKWDVGYDWSKGDHQGFAFSSDGDGAAGSAYYPDGCASNDWMLLESRGSGNSGSFFWYVYQPGKNLDPDPNKWNPWGVSYGTGAPVTSGRWYPVEVMVDLGTPTPTISGANGSMEVWVNGQSYGRKSGLWFRTCDSLQLRFVDIMTYARAEWVQPGISIYYDDVVVSTQPIGAGTRVDYARNTLSIATSTLPEAKKDSAYSVWLNGIGGIKPYAWSLASGALPQGLAMNSVAGNLNIKGTPTVSGVFSFSLQLRDSGTGQTATKSLILNVNPITGSLVRGSGSRGLANLEWTIGAGTLLLRLPANHTASIVRIFDTRGKLIWEGTAEKGLARIQSPRLSNGLYIGKLLNGRGTASFRFAMLE